MSEPKFQYFIHYRPRKSESIAMRHAVIVEKMTQLPAPLSWRQLSIPTAPDITDSLTTYYDVQYPIEGLSLIASYTYRGDAYPPTDAVEYDDKVRILFNPNNPKIDYRKMIYEDLAAATRAFGGHLGRGFFADYLLQYMRSHEELLKRLKSIPGINLNGYNNILALQPVQFWDAELCQRALGYGRDEVIHRLQGEVLLVTPLMDGVYIVFNDNPDLTFEEFCAVNDRFKPILGLV